jgi:hypothetical protein
MNSEEPIVAQESQEKPQEETVEETSEPVPVVKIDLAEAAEVDVQPEATEAEVKTEAESGKPMTV